LQKRIRRIAAVGLLSALALAVTYPLAGIPNVKFFELCLFLSGIFLGFRGGVSVPLIAGTIYIMFNPNGPQTVLLVGIAQIVGFLLFGLAGAVFGKMILANNRRLIGMTFCAAIGVFLTFVYDLITNAAWGITIGALMPAIYSGIAFSLLHMAANGLIFGLAEPLLVRIWKAVYPLLD